MSFVTALTLAIGRLDSTPRQAWRWPESVRSSGRRPHHKILRSDGLAVTFSPLPGRYARFAMFLALGVGMFALVLALALGYVTSAWWLREQPSNPDR